MPHSSYDSERAADQARERLDLKRIIEQRGFGPRKQGEKWNSFECPLCKHKAAGIVERGGRFWFKCFHSSCASAGGKAVDEVGFIALIENIGRPEAWRRWLQEAGVWKEEVRAPSLMPGSRPRKSEPPPCPESKTGAAAPLTPEPDGVGDGQVGPAVSAPQADAAPITDSIPEKEPEMEPASSFIHASDPQPAEGHGEESLPPIQSDVEPPEPAEPEPEKPGPLTAFVARTSLLASHAIDCRTRRGIPDEAIAQEAFRSSVRGNKAILSAMESEFGIEALVECGLWSPASARKGARPNPIFYGYGNSGKKDENGAMVRAWTEPVLIPYWDPRNPDSCFYLRPHKDGVAGHDAHLYVPRGQPERIRKVMVTEGEFKALAFLQAGIPGVGACAIPGISMVREDSPGSMSVLGELWAWLDQIGAREVVVVFDNEDKSLRVPDKKKRYEAERWARYLAIIVAKRGVRGLVGRLPEEWREGGEERDGKQVGGKVDWDSALARLRRLGMPPGDVRAAFQSVLDGAFVPGEPHQAGLFDSEEERIIQAGLARMFYVPKLAKGGSREKKVAAKLLKCLERIGGATALVGKDAAKPKGAARAALIEGMAAAYRETKDRYYVLRRATTDPEMEWWRKLLTDAREEKMWDIAFLAERVLQGVPFPKTDFVVEPLYSVRKADGDVYRRCRLRNVRGENRLLDIGGELHSPVRFRERCVNAGSFSWGGDERDLHALREDVNFVLFGQEVREVTHYGWHPGAKMWIAADGAITDAGETLLPDEEGIIWRDGIGYLVSEFDREGESFRLGQPRWHLTKGLKITSSGGFALESGQDDPSAVSELADGLMNALFNTTNSGEAWLALGAVVAYAIGPEFYAREQFFPGLWITGLRQSGKTTIARFLMSVLGFSCEAGVALGSTTAPGVLITAQQYSHLGIWLDDYRPEVPQAVREVLRQLWDRSSGSKKEMSGSVRRVLTNAIITSEHTSRDSATRQRFVHLHLAAEKRAAGHDDMPWFRDNAKYLFTLFRHILRRPTDFTRLFWKEYDLWRAREDLNHLEARTRGNHGVAFAAAKAFMSVIGYNLATAFKLEEAAISVALEGDETARAEGNMQVFFREMAISFKTGGFSEDNGGVRRFFAVRQMPSDGPDGGEIVEAWKVFPRLVLLFDAESVHAKIRERLRKGSREMPIELADLRQQMAAQPYWIGGQRFRMRLKNGSPQATDCWGIDLDRHPFGRRRFETPEAESRAVQEAWETAQVEAQSDAANGGVAFGPTTTRRYFADPRAGELHLIAYAVLDAAEKERAER